MMELPQARPFGGEGRKPTHDFLSLCTLPNLQQDATPRSSQENFLETHDFLGKTNAKEEVSTEISSAERPPPAAPPPSGEHLLPGGIGTYSISHISHLNQRTLKPHVTLFPVAQTSSTTERNDDNSNCSSYANSSFILWDESTAKKGKTRKENAQTKESAMKGSQSPLLEKPLQSSSNNNRHRNSPPGQKNQSFLDMIKSAKTASSQEEDLDDDEEFLVKKEISPAVRDVKVNVDGKSSDQKANTPRSKHSATEQRRRSKINDRFQTLRTLLPQNDQKRDKASFLLEVIEYIQFLQERVQKFEGSSYSGWNQEHAKMMTWQRSDQKPGETYEDHARSAHAGSATLDFATKLAENNISPAGSFKNHPGFKEGEHVNQAVINESVSVPVSVQPNILVPTRVSGSSQLSQMVDDSDLGTKGLHPQSHVCQTKPMMGELNALNYKIKEQELAIEGGMISISTAYSRGLFDTLTQALHSSGVDLSQASISLQIELGKRAKSSAQKDSEAPCSNQGCMVRGQTPEDDSMQAMKKFKTRKS
ncbi:hypothetical protein SAY87_010470 [Trapa incisa]|uniref:BHLH domain-containing protein n=1 Tax=Trapa incisa TaxID=236973 RepID=A0AAN7JIE5_9MYRT|nr:hypothetical protein SAY87_010470 [Trapa incisa]